MACGPDVIFIGGWLAGSYDALSQIAPVVYLATDSDLANLCICRILYISCLHGS